MLMEDLFEWILTNKSITRIDFESIGSVGKYAGMTENFLIIHVCNDIPFQKVLKGESWIDNPNEGETFKKPIDAYRKIWSDDMAISSLSDGTLVAFQKEQYCLLYEAAIAIGKKL